MTDACAQAIIPIGSTVGVPAGGLDAKISAGREAREQVSGVTETSGERIYAICYRRVIITSRKGNLDAKLKSGNIWIPSPTLGDDEPEDEYIEAQIEDYDDTSSCKILPTAGLEEEMPVFALDS